MTVAVRPLPPPPRRILSISTEAGSMPQRTTDSHGPMNPSLRSPLNTSSLAASCVPVPRASDKIRGEQPMPLHASPQPSTWRGGRSSSVPASLDCLMPAEAPPTSAPTMRSSLGDLACPPLGAAALHLRPQPPAPSEGDFLSFLHDGTTVVAIFIPCVHPAASYLNFC
jgi:hypothetical protein